MGCSSRLLQQHTRPSMALAAPARLLSRGLTTSVLAMAKKDKGGKKEEGEFCSWVLAGRGSVGAGGGGDAAAARVASALYRLTTLSLTKQKKPKRRRVLGDGQDADDRV